MSASDEVADALKAIAIGQRDGSTVSMTTVRGLYDFSSSDPSKLPFKVGETIYVIKKHESGWWNGVIPGDKVRFGWFPATYVEELNKAAVEIKSRTTPPITPRTTSSQNNSQNIVQPVNYINVINYKY